MKIEKAIEIKEAELPYFKEEYGTDFIQADILSIEALKLVQRERLLGINPVETLLPGETKD